MDKLAKEGTYFTHAMSTTPICAASRASILTGLYERAHNFNFQTGNVREEYMEKAYPRILKQEGYTTAFYGKFGVRYDQLNLLFDQYESYDRNGNFSDKRGYFYKTIAGDTVHLTRYTGQQALDFIENTNSDKPFCLSLSFSAPHAHDSAEDQYFWQEETDYWLQNTDAPSPDLGEDKYFNMLPEIVKAGFNRLRWTWRYDTPQKYQHSVKGYYRMIAGIDLEIEKIRNKLIDKGLDKNTVIILIGDNGYFLGERQLAGKWLMYDNSVRVPLIVYDPRVKKHQDIDEMVLNIDVPSTILDLAGVKQPEQWQGKSLMDLVNQKTKSLNRDTLLIEHIWEFDNIPPSEGVRTKEWKYFRYVNDQSIEELYNLAIDPKETNNLVSDPTYQENLTKLRSKCNELIKQNSNNFRKGPDGLTVELIRNPTGLIIIDQKPEYSWLVPEAAVYQSAYQIIVASTEQNIHNNIGDVWNSGQIRSNKSTNIEHVGDSLKQGMKYYWKVRIWDEDNRLLDYSDFQTFVVGLATNTITTSNKIIQEKIAPITFEKNEEGYFIDFGKDAFATLEFDHQVKKTETLTFHFGEELINGRINRQPKGYIRYQKVELQITPQQKKYVLKFKPDEKNTKPEAIQLPDSIPVLMPFRYVEIEQTKAKINKEDLVQLAYFNYWENDQSNFECSDSILNKVWEICKYSIKATSFAGTYIDGDRERIPYEADAYLNQLSHYATDQEYAIARKTIEYFMEHPTWPTDWQLHVALMFYADYMHTGNIELIQKYYEPLKHKTLMELRREDGLISSSLSTPEFMQKLGFKNPKIVLKDNVDWPPAQKDTGWKLANEEGERDGFVFQPINTVINCLYYRNMRIMAEFAELLGKTEESSEFNYLAELAKMSINSKLFDKNTGAYIDGEGTNHSSLHANMFALAFDLVPEINKKSVVDFIKSRGMACSVYGSQYLLEGLYNANEPDYALELMTATHDRSWYNMIKIGSTVTLEAWDMKYKPNADWNHAWGATPANIIPNYLWGIQPKIAGYEIATIKPQMSGLRNSSVVVPTIKGKIKANYSFVNDRLQIYNIEIPANMVAEFELSNLDSSSIKLNGEKVSTAFGNIRLNPGNNKIELVVNSF